ncbi:hypothetical protein BDP27DRAFT_1440073 [Rhodocollybia butyracea]|uniref:Uncharacterized protein n=1 Tax=Rhodocollybia butyracea TaxID=206335 RepID=A0A9P5TVM5_9AGAR|nr:hypothetical protein BDP27DRAFT_1440073 [Rhodocollybia butyracea]
MGPEEQHLIFVEAKALLLAVPMMVVLTGYGAFLLGFVVAVQSLTIRGPWGRPQTILLLCLVTILVCFTWTVLDNGGGLLMIHRLMFMQTLEQGIIAQLQAADKEIVIWGYFFDWPVTILASITYIIHGSSFYTLYHLFTASLE